MMRLPKFHYWMPKTAAEAVRIKEESGPEGAYVAGGTDLYPNMKRRQQIPKEVIGLLRVRGLARVRFSQAGVSIGAAKVAAFWVFAAFFPVLAVALFGAWKFSEDSTQAREPVI